MIEDCYCGGECWIVLADLHDQYGECVGAVSVIDEISDGTDYYWAHGCEKHSRTWDELY